MKYAPRFSSFGAIVLALFDKIKQALERVYRPLANSSDPRLKPALTVANHFLLDFQRSGIHLDPSSQRQFVELSTEVVQLGRKFFNPQPSETQFVSISDEEAKRMSPSFAQILGSEAEGRTAEGHYVIDSREWCGTVLARQHPNEETRRKVWTAANTSSTDAIETLEELLLTRNKLARTVGLENWAQVALSDKMAKTPGPSIVLWNFYWGGAVCR
jgi:mitochondrial intermediate peptidase